ncbi:ATP synthase [Bacillus coahuilensis m2-6]|uniref:TrkH family potassium uptake protein n=1 Tax=Bacillus coahuilensis TaxID=408580 RepID=UPI0007505B36|nr:TrkH family potassium uptake protein [Bacillus coahuilensis]KUP08901.1 ATP synthase [Bacillus coahuilensis m2-6]
MLRKEYFFGFKFTPAQLIGTYYFIAITVSTILLSLPFAHQEGVDLSFIDVLFTGVSAISVTGLTVINTAETFNTVGIIILMLILQVGGIGVMTLGTFIWVIFGKKIGLKERRLIMTDQNLTSLSGLVKILKEILWLIIIIELVGSIILSIYFLTYFPTWQEAVINGIFASVTATTNAGFDITGQSLIPFAEDYFVQFIVILLMILGAIGFPVLIEVKSYLINRDVGTKNARFSLFAKVTSITFFILLVVGTILIYLLELNGFFKEMSWHKAFFYALFHSASTKSGGLSTMDVSVLSEPTLLVISGLMFIGASPSSVGGGIRTTTLALNILFLFHFSRGRKDIKIFKREIHQEDIFKSLVVTTFALMLCFTAIIVLSISEDHALIEILFEVCSAFGTTGLSMGITPEMSTFGKVVLMILMFIGRVGILSFLFIIGGKEKRVMYHYPKERIIIG